MSLLSALPLDAYLIWAAALSFGLSVLVVLTTRWHGAFSMDAAHGVQKLHTHPTPRVGGLPILLALLAAGLWVPLPADPGGQTRTLLLGFAVAAVPAFVFGLAEDLTKSVGVLPRLLATMGSGVLAWLMTGHALTSVNVWGLDWLLQFTPLAVLFTAFAVGGVANAINIIDGLNGLASSVLLWAFLGLATLAASVGDVALAQVCLLLAASVLGFFIVNWPLGKLFLGDGGSYFLGFALAWACVLLIERNSGVSAFAALLLCIHPVTEVVYSMYRRKVRNQNPGHPDRLHFHSLVKRRVIQRLLPHSSKTVRNSVAGLLVGSITLLSALLAQVTYSSTPASLAAAVSLAVGYVWLYRRVRSLKR